MMLMKRTDTKSKEQIQAEDLARLNSVEVRSVRERERDYAQARNRIMGAETLAGAGTAPPIVQQRRGSGGGTPPGGGVQVAAPAGRGFGGRGRGKR